MKPPSTPAPHLKPPKRGGRRPRAGRPRTNRHPYMTRLSMDSAARVAQAALHSRKPACSILDGLVQLHLPKPIPQAPN